jgi:hypothetical protein
VYPHARRGQGIVVISGDEKKRAENEAIFREANERIRAAERELAPPLDHLPYICECDDVDCRETIRLTAPEYERIRDDGATFAIAPGHPSEGDVLEQHDGYLVVRKRDGGGEVARALDPRGEDA